MKLKEIKTKYGRNMRAVFECEFCNDEYSANVYDDGFFFEYVVPELTCKKCDKKSFDRKDKIA